MASVFNGPQPKRTRLQHRGKKRILASEKWRQAVAANSTVKQIADDVEHPRFPAGAKSKACACAPADPLQMSQPGCVPEDHVLAPREPPARGIGLKRAKEEYEGQLAYWVADVAENERQWAIGVARAELAAPADP